MRRNPSLSVDVDGLLYLGYTFTPNLLFEDSITLYEYFTNKQALIDRRTYLGKDCRYTDFHNGVAYVQNSQLYPHQL